MTTEEVTWRTKPIAVWDWIVGDYSAEQAKFAWDMAKEWGKVQSDKTFTIENLPLSNTNYCGALGQKVLVDLFESRGLLIKPNWVKGKGDGGVDFWLPAGSVDVKSSHFDPQGEYPPKMFSWENDLHVADFYFSVMIWEGKWYFLAAERSELFIHPNHYTLMKSKKYPEINNKPCYSKITKWCTIMPVDTLYRPFTHKFDPNSDELSTFLT